MDTPQNVRILPLVNCVSAEDFLSGQDRPQCPTFLLGMILIVVLIYIYFTSF